MRDEVEVGFVGEAARREGAWVRVEADEPPFVGDVDREDEREGARVDITARVGVYAGEEADAGVS
mgnify:FL=1